MKPPQAARKAARTKTRSLYGYGRSPITSTRRSLSRMARQSARPMTHCGPRDEEHCHHVDEGKPVEVLRVEYADEEVGESVDIEDDPFFAAGQAAGFVWTITVPAWAKASVTIAKAIPATRRLTAPNTSGTATATTASSASVAGRPHSHSVSAIAGT